MKVIYNIKVERNVTEEERQWLVNHNVFNNETLTKHINDNKETIEDLLSHFDADKLLDFTVEIINDNM